MKHTLVVSFDLDGTITDGSFADSVWLEGIPRFYAGKEGISFEKAKIEVKKEYDKVGRTKLEWYDPSFWIKKFDLDISPKEVLNSFKNKIRLFPEVSKVIQDLKKKGLKLIVISNAHREFVDLQLRETRIAKYFDHVFSASSDFGLIKNTATPFERACDVCRIALEDMVHVGDDLCFDYETPKKLGIHAFFLDRTGKCKETFAIHNLLELNGKIERLNWPDLHV
jgi:putative hydrolase of the HAD superfamily